ncbi:MAG: hypothetical protein M3R51_08600 [Candidatus Eremiobacteraeota bacterium]|nr:hypothetical protein [Candidatus Eremiobacteraeota bacterium]
MRLVKFAALSLLALALLPATARTQTLAQSTVDRQTIGQLQSELSAPNVTPAQRREIEMQISELRYQIDTRPAIQVPGPPPPAFAPPGPPANFSAPAPPEAIDVSCDAYRSVIAYLSGELGSTQASTDERAAISQQIARLNGDLHSHHCR